MLYYMYAVVNTYIVKICHISYCKKYMYVIK